MTFSSKKAFLDIMTLKTGFFEGLFFEIRPKMRKIMTKHPVFIYSDIMTGIFDRYTAILRAVSDIFPR